MTSIDTSALPDKAAFAAANGWEYTAAGPAPDVDVPLFTRLEGATVTDRFSDSASEAGNLTGAIRGTTRKFSVGYLAVRLTRPIAHFELESTRNNATKGTTVPLSIPDGHRMALFGEYANSFALYGPDGHEGDALNLFTTDLLALLSDVTGDFDVEVVNDVFLVAATKPFDLGDATLWNRLNGIRTLVNEKDLTPALAQPQQPLPAHHGTSAAVVGAEAAVVASIGATAIGTVVGIVGAVVGVVAAIIGVIVSIVATFAVH